jgi:ubiquinone biosynthesis protein
MGRIGSRLELLQRVAVLLLLIVRGAGLYARAALAKRAVLRLSSEEVDRRYGSFAADFVAAASRFRGGLIKLGQVASLRIDVLPESVTDELAKLQDRVEPHPFREIEEQLRRELGEDWRSQFSAFEELPIASASLGQVHRATALDGSALAVKVLYPGIEASVSVDLAMAKLALWLFDWILVPDLMQVYQQVRASLLGEMDYEREGRAAERIAQNLASDAALFVHLRIPRIHWAATRRRVLCMEFIEGDKINDRERLEARGVDIDEVVTWASRAFLHMMLRDGDFHCDPHPGNLFVDEEGRVAIIDFGMNMQLRPGTLLGLRDHVVAAVSRSVEGFARSLVTLDMIDECDLPAVESLAELALDPKHFNLTPKEMMELDFVEYFREMSSRMGQIRGFRIPDGLVMWGRALTLLYGLVAELAPGVRPMDIVGPYVLGFLQGNEPGAESAASRSC